MSAVTEGDVLLCRVELVRNNGRLLRAFGFDECTGARSNAGGNEFRGVRRADLLRVLLEALPKNTVRFDQAVERITTTPSGETEM